MNRMTKYKALLYVQWKHQRMELMLFTMLAGGIPALVTWSPWSDWGSHVMTPTAILSTSTSIGLLGAILAVAVGVVLAIRPYALDALGRHTYAAALPIPRTEYGLLRVACGMVLLLLPAAGFLVGSLLASAAIELPPMLHAYPVAITVRFVLATAMAFALAFSVQYGLGKHAARWIVIAVFVAGAIEAAGQLVASESLTGPFWTALASEASPLRVFAANWMLFDV
jgi:hypothetical protein